MTKEDNELMIKDLSARLPYGVKCHFKYGSAEDDITLSCIDNNVARFEYGWYGSFHVSIDADYIKPYLRSMNSMTEEERKEYIDIDNRSYSCPMDYAHIPALERIDWFNTHHFDYRGLIKKGLALEAPKDMYK